MRRGRLVGPRRLVDSADGRANCFVALFKSFGFFAFEASFITVTAQNVRRSGCRLRDVQLLSGRRSIEATERYIDGDTFSQRKLVSYV